MVRTWFIGDPHFFHKNIIEYENRPFVNTDEMDKELIKIWNSRVAKQDIVYVLGDFAFGNRTMIKELVPKLNGVKHLIMGNHDRYSTDFYREAGFKEVYRHPIILYDFLILSHQPMYVSENTPYMNMFAHVHGNPMYKDYTDKTICVSVERKHMGYGPIVLEDVKKLMGIAA